MGDVLQGPGTSRPRTPFGEPSTSSNGGNGGDDFEQRLRRVELDVREIKTRTENIATKQDIEIAVEKLKTRTENIATKQDIEIAVEKLKRWAITAVASAAVSFGLTVIGWLVLWIVRLMSQESAP